MSEVKTCYIDLIMLTISYPVLRYLLSQSFGLAYLASIICTVSAIICILPLLVQDALANFRSHKQKRTNRDLFLIVLSTQSILFAISAGFYIVGTIFSFELHRAMSIFIQFYDVDRGMDIFIQFYEVAGDICTLSLVPLISFIIYSILHFKPTKISRKLFLIIATVVGIFVLNAITVITTPHNGPPGFDFLAYASPILLLFLFVYLIRVMLQPSGPMQNVLKFFFTLCLGMAVSFALLLATPVIFEQVISKGKFCFGISCPINKEGIDRVQKLLQSTDDMLKKK